jgi:hypothetical protein
MDLSQGFHVIRGLGQLPGLVAARLGQEDEGDERAAVSFGNGTERLNGSAGRFDVRRDLRKRHAGLIICAVPLLLHREEPAREVLHPRGEAPNHVGLLALGLYLPMVGRSIHVRPSVLGALIANQQCGAGLAEGMEDRV